MPDMIKYVTIFLPMTYNYDAVFIFILIKSNILFLKDKINRRVRFIQPIIL